MKVLVTGGAGYIGSHTAVELLEAGYEVVVVDDLSNSHKEALERVQQITGKRIEFHQGDIRDKAFLDSVFSACQIDMVMHFAGLKAVGESCKDPAEYYDVNVGGSISLCRVMQEHDVGRVIFSSTASIYGQPDAVPVDETGDVRPESPYARTKRAVERFLEDLVHTASEHGKQGNNGWQAVLLRYFNPIGAHSSGRIGEDPSDVPNNLMPYICQVASGKLEKLNIFGDDYLTPDGTGIRDYIHVVDLARGHISAMEKLLSLPPAENRSLLYNLGTGQGYSVLDIVNAFEEVNGIEIPRVVAPRRGGDVAEYFADPALANRELGWKAEMTLQDMVGSAWNWQMKNPGGYRSPS